MAPTRKKQATSSLNRYGVFSADGSEFVIQRPDTPRPWINYLTNERYCAIISHCAGGYSFYKDCRANRITRWSPESYKVDRPGRYLYLRERSRFKVQGSRKADLASNLEPRTNPVGIGYGARRISR
ncbi:MAG: hypothetical protein HYZ92_00585 [Candidatus Omnitrophica bacterium]|nr:hypothetical protein [Candidatus Omnitrophota bacterium]